MSSPEANFSADIEYLETVTDPAERKRLLAMLALKFIGYEHRQDEVWTGPFGDTAVASEWPKLCHDHQGTDHSDRALAQVENVAGNYEALEYTPPDDPDRPLAEEDYARSVELLRTAIDRYAPPAEQA